MALRTNRLVIGLDYGTTFTGVAFQAVTDVQGDVMNTPLLVMDWPGTNNEKVPSEYSYSPSDGVKKQWGGSFSPNSLKLIWTKLELEQQSSSDELDLILGALDGTNNLDFNTIQQARGLPAYPAKDSVQIVTDFLIKVREKLWEELVQTFPPAILTIPVDLVISVPALWSEAATDRTFRTVCNAGFDERCFPRLREIILVSEPEATALSLLKSLRPRFGDVVISPGESLVVCDAGGGTVDLISYQVTQTNPTIQAKRITLGAGYKCGATFIDRHFRDWLKQKLGSNNFQRLTGVSAFQRIGSHTYVEPRMQGLMHDFEIIKHNFAGVTDRGGISKIQLPAPLNNLNIPDKGIDRGEISITEHDMEAMFKFSVEKTIDLIAAEIGQVESRDSRVKYVFLSGGFASSKYLFNQVELFCQLRQISLQRPENCWSAVVRGAVARGVEFGDDTDLIYLRKCRRNYGISVSRVFSPWRHKAADAYLDPFDGQEKAKDQIVWLIRKGDAIWSTKPKCASVELCRRFGRNDPKVFKTSLVSCGDDVAPPRLADIPMATRSLATVTYDFERSVSDQIRIIPAVGRGEAYCVVDFKIEISIEQHVELQVSCNGIGMGSTSIPYP